MSSIAVGEKQYRKKEKQKISDKEIMELYQKNKKQGTEAAIRQYERYIYSLIHKKYNTFEHEIEDLYQAGCEGVLRALEKYDASKGAFYNYCYGYIKKEFAEYLCFLMGESSTYYMGVHRKVMRAKEQIEETGEKSTIDAIVKMTSLSEKIVRRELQVDYTRVSLEKCIDQEG